MASADTAQGSAPSHAEEGRWVGEYQLASGTPLASLWADLRRDVPGRVLLISGRGFDPRMTLGASVLSAAGWDGQVTVALLTWGGGVASPKSLDVLATENLSRLTTLLPSATIEAVAINTANNSHVVSANSAGALVSKLVSLGAFSHIILDVSALPRALYFPIAAALLSEADALRAEPPINVHVFVSEDPVLDGQIRDQELEERAEYLPGFTSDLASESHAHRSKIWIPVLGEGQAEHLSRIYTHVAPNEICPVLPSPARDPRRADNLVLEYHALLFDQLRVEPRNIIYADEQNPFELYRQLHRTIQSYESALLPIGGCRCALSAHSSKLMSVGVLLTAYEMKRTGHSIGVVHLESTRSDISFDAALGIDDLTRHSELHGLWLAGECYVV